MVTKLQLFNLRASLPPIQDSKDLTGEILRRMNNADLERLEELLGQNYKHRANHGYNLSNAEYFEYPNDHVLVQLEREIMDIWRKADGNKVAVRETERRTERSRSSFTAKGANRRI